MHAKRIPLLLLSTLAACAVPVDDPEMTGGGADTDAATAGDDGIADDGSGDDGGPATDGSEDPDGTAGTTDPDGTGDTTDGTTSVCGDGSVQGDEVCDDGINDGQYGGCAEDCSAFAAYCGDATIDENEVCDDGVNDGQYDGCAEDCQALAAYCGDGELDPVEFCDDGNDAINDGCNPDCTTPGMMVWGETWDSFGGVLPNGYDGSPAGINYVGNGNVQLAATETADGDSIWNLQIDAATGEVLSADQLSPPTGGTYTAMASARVGDGTIIAALNRDNGPDHSTLLYMGADGGLDSTFDQIGIAPWQRIEGDPDSEAFAVLRNTGAELHVREFVGSVQTFANDNNGSASDIAIGYAGSVLHMAARFQLFGPPGLLVFSWPNGPDAVIGGTWTGGGALDDVSAHALIGTNGGGQLVVGDYAEGGPMRSVIAKFSGVPEAPATWVISNADGTATGAAAEDVCETPDGNFIVVGWSLPSAGVHRTRIRKITANGSVLWDHTLDDGVHDRNWVTCDDTGGALVTGTVNGQIWYGRFAP